MFDFNEYIKLAEDLIQKTDESYKRSAVSRAYYGALMHAKKSLIEMDKYPSDDNGNSHEKIWNAFKHKDFGQKGKNIASMGHRLKEKRKAADYKTKINDNLDSWSKMAVSEAKALVKQMNSLKK